MKDKLISALIGAVLGGLIVLLYTNLISVPSNNTGPNGSRPAGGSGAALDVSTMSDDQLEKMATRAGITKDELKAKLDAGEDIRSLMGNQNGNGGGGNQLNSTGNTTPVQ
ncbi:MAG: hypothetical protein PHV23_03505 [Candidatus Gracilibacteria bacterium]|nr:hypothetical protein [Candidatus Gracilibacteria bacterium]